MTQIHTTQALKEWAVAVNALETGKTIMLLRKGGIREQQGRFQVQCERVLLYPTYEHQKPELLKTPYAHQVKKVDSGWHPSQVRIGCWAEITDVFPVVTKETLATLDDFHIWNDRFITERLNWKPQQPLYIILLRVYKLSPAIEIPYDQRYGGCRSWIQLEREIAIGKANPSGSMAPQNPAIPDTDYGIMVDKIRTAISRITKA